MYVVIDTVNNKFISMWENENQARDCAEWMGEDFTIGYIPTDKKFDEIAAMIWE